MSQGKSTIPLAEPDSAVSPKALRLTVVAGPDAGRIQILTTRRVEIGRGEHTQLRLTDPTVSDFHVDLCVCPRGIQVLDPGSRNGIRISGVRIERGIVSSGCVLHLGSSSVRVDLADERQSPPEQLQSFGRLVGQSKPMLELYARLAKLAPTDISVLIEGETGTGKELVARALHDASLRRGHPFVVLDCSTLHESLAPSKLFGHEKGAFTDAHQRRAGVFEAANGGTVFLDEIGELPRSLQPKLLRVLQEREVTPEGSNLPRPINVRILCATWRDLRSMVNKDLFRADLYYRLIDRTVQVPSLSQRREDVSLLVQHFLAGLPPGIQAARSITTDALAMLCARTYPGNIRELRKLIENLAMLAQGPSITVEDLVSERENVWDVPLLPTVSSLPVPLDGPLPPFKEAKQEAIDRMELEYLLKLLSRTGYNISRAAEEAGLERQSLRELLRKHKLYRGPE